MDLATEPVDLEDFRSETEVICAAINTEMAPFTEIEPSLEFVVGPSTSETVISVHVESSSFFSLSALGLNRLCYLISEDMTGENAGTSDASADGTCDASRFAEIEWGDTW